MVSIILLVGFTIFIAATEIVPGWKMSFLQKVAFSGIPIAVLAFQFLDSKVGGTLIPLLGATIPLLAGTAVLVLSAWIQSMPESEKQKIRDDKHE